MLLPESMGMEMTGSGKETESTTEYPRRDADLLAWLDSL